MFDYVDINNSPALAGLRFRRLHDAGDFEQMARVHEASADYDAIDRRSSRERVPTAADLATMFELPAWRESADLLLAEIDGQIVGYNHVAWRWTESDLTRVYLHLGYLEPRWRGMGIGSSLLGWSQRRIRELAAAERPEHHVTFATNASSTEREALALITAAGYLEVRRLSDMALEPIAHSAPPALPPGLELRRLQPSQYRALYACWKDAYRELWTTTAESEQDFEEFVGDYFNPAVLDVSLCTVAWAGELVAGFVVASKRHGHGQIDEVVVRPAWRRRGLALGMMLRAIGALHAQGVQHARLFTDAANGQGARSLYERLGFVELKQHVLFRRQFEL